MKISKRQLRRIIREQTATVDDEKIEDVVMTVLSDEGGAAGLEPIEDALEELEDEDISLPDESIEDLIGDITGVKRHADGDYVDTTQLESKGARLTASQLRQIIREETVGVEDPSKTANAFGGGDISDEMFVDVDEEVLLNVNEQQPGAAGIVPDLKFIPEGKAMKISKRQLRRIIKEEKKKLEEMDPASAGMAAAREEARIRNQGIDPTMGIFNSNYIYDMFYDELAEIQPTAANISREAFALFQRAVDGAVSKIEEDLVR